MSDSQKQERSVATPIKNPLLSASVTGLTFDDFPNKPLLLPAAPPIVHSPAPLITSSGLITREPKSLVTVGSSSLDTESLDEINLNASNEENQTSDITDPNSNPLLEQSYQTANSDSILSQAASSFSALPSVASNVFSTFSKRITSISSRETTPIYDQHQQDSNDNTLVPQIDVQPTYIQESHTGNLSQAPPPLFAPPLGGNYISSVSATSGQQETQPNFHSAEPPKFYTPADVPPVPPKGSAAPPTNLSGQNNFRFSSKKKVYAPVPGLCGEDQKQTTTIIDSSSTSANVSAHEANISSNYYSQPQDSNNQVGFKSKFGNLASFGVQNITGLLQSAAGSLTQTYKSEVTSPAIDLQNNYLSASPSPANYFSSQSQGVQQTNKELSVTPTQHSQHTNAQTTQPFFGGQQFGTSNYFTQQSINANSHQQPPTLAPTTLTSQTEIPLFNPSNIPIQINPRSSPQPSNLGSKHLPSNEPSTTQTASSNSQSSHSLPPTANLKIPPPASGHTSYRLQKGTKLYKNPLTPQETTSIPVTPNQSQAINQSVNNYSSQQGLNPLQSVPLFAPPLAGDQKITQSVPLITSAESVSSQSAPAINEFKPNDTTKSELLFAPPPPPLAPFKSHHTSQSIPFLSSPYDPIQINSALTPQVGEFNIEEQTTAPPTKKLKYNDFVQDVPNITAAPENKNLFEPKTNEAEQSLDVEIKEHNNVDNKESIFEPIKPVLEENLTKTQKETIEDPIEEALQKLSIADLSSESKLEKLPSITESFNLNNRNRNRRGSASETAKPTPSLPTLANFFKPEPSNGSTDLNFFAAFPATQSSGNEINFFHDKEINKENLKPFGTLHADTTNYFTSPGLTELTPLEPHTDVQPPISAFFPKLPTSLGLAPAILEEENDITKHLNESFAQKKIPPPIGFESFTQLEPTAPALPDNTAVHHINTTIQQETKNETQQPEIVNRFSNYFNQANQQTEIVKDPLTFFDSFTGQQSTQPLQQQQQQQQQQQIEVSASAGAVTNEEQRIQYFFNNPPPKDASAVGDLNYDLVHSGLGIKNLQQRSLTPISNLVEPPSSACSEFSELSNSTAGQKSIAANLSITENSEKELEKEETVKRVIEEQNSSLTLNISTENYKELPEEILKDLGMSNQLSADKTATTPVASVSYKPAVKHWFFKRTTGDKHIWVPFSHYDSALLETSLLMREGEEKSNIVAVEGGRYDVNIRERKKMSVYWESQPIEVRRCSWFYKAVDSKYVPYAEQTADVLENEYKQAAESGVWHKTIVLGMGEQVVFHGPTVIVHFQQQQNSDAWGGTTQTATRPRVVKRDLDDFNIEQGESQKVDHLLFMVHGIGSACDLKLRSVEEVVEDFRTIARQLVQSHYKNSTDLGLVGRVEVLPISWHSHLHSAEMGIDEKLRMITLESIPKLRNFTNDTLLDILFYTSPTFCQKIMNTIVSSINTLYLKYRERHPEFNGGVSLAGHSLGSLILFDLLCHQNPIKESEENNLENPNQLLARNLNNTQMDTNQLEDQQMSYTMGPAGTGQPFINYGQLIFQPKKFFALGSPIGMFVTIRGIDKLGLDFRLPTCSGFYNIFHPYDPVAYRIEALVNPDLSGVRPVLIPHHKGRKRMHLELKETMARVSTDLKNRFMDKFKTTLESVNIFGSTSKSTKEAEELMEKEVDKVIQMQIQLEQRNNKKTDDDSLPSGSDNQNETSATNRKRTDSASTAMSDDAVEIDFPLGKLNDSKRIDYVLQEAPLEFINEYIFALSSHVCYWDSEDTILFVMKEIYAGLGISPDSQVPQQTMTIERPSSRNNSLLSIP